MAFIQNILDDARRRLAVLSRETPVCEVAAILADPNTPLVVICDSNGIAVGVASRADIVKVFAREGEAAHTLSAEAIMSAPVLSCRIDQTLQSVWTTMGARRLRCSPVLDEFGKPQGIVHARDIARALLAEATSEESLMRDYVLGIGY